MELKSLVLKTHAYSAFFNFPLFPSEVHHWLITPKQISFLDTQSVSNFLLSSEEVSIRRDRSIATLNKIKIAKKLGRILFLIPGIRFVGLTGSVAANNATVEDDIDLLIITSKNTLWVMRPLILLIISILFRRRLPNENPAHTKDAFCPNLWLDTESLLLPKIKRNLYTAHEILQIIPIVDKGNTYMRFLVRNSWTKKYLANAFSSRCSFNPPEITEYFSIFKTLVFPVNFVLYAIQYLYMLPKKTTETVHVHGAFLHTNNYSNQLRRHINKFKDI